MNRCALLVYLLAPGSVWAQVEAVDGGITPVDTGVVAPVGAPAGGVDAGPPPPPPPAMPAQVDAGVPDSALATPTPERAKDVPPLPSWALHRNAGYANGAFFLRSDDDNFIFIPSGRFQMDFLGYQGGVNAPANTFFPRRARLEAFGTIMKHWDFQLGSEFTNSTTPIATDIYLNANYSRYANVEIGQFDAPFTMENRTSDKWTDLQERSRVIAAFAIPENKEVGAMVWGQPEGKWAYWSTGLFNGEGLQNFKHGSNNFDSMSRAWLAPFGLMDNDLLRNVWLGGSYWHGNRQSSTTNQLDRLAMTDQARFTFWNPVYGSIHAGDQGELNKWGVELNAPIGSVVLKGEVVGLTENTRELDETTPSKPVVVRNGLLKGTGYYGRASYFVWGDALINGLAGTQNPPRLFGELAPGKTDDALQIVLNADHMSFSYSAADGASGTKDKLVGDYDVSIFGAGVNYWYTKHIRLTADFMYDVLGGPGPKPEATSNNEFEITARVALAL